jgi:signal transduction histidine kinase
MKARSLPAARLAEVIARRKADIERQWLERVERDVVSGESAISPTHLRDGLPDYLTELVKLLSADGLDLTGTAQPAWAKVAREHGITRVRIGFDINQLIHEFVILRHVIRQMMREEGVDVNAPEALLADSLDAAIAAAVSAYVDARDYDSRRRQAENIAFLTHELRNPLSTATVSAAHLRDHAAPEQIRFLDSLDRSLQRLASLIDSVLLTEQLEAGKVESRPVDLRLGQVIEPALEAARALASKRGISFRAAYDPDLRVRLDPLLTRSAIQNLADNAAKYVDTGHVELTVDDLEDRLVIHVRDTCAGISEAELRTIFEPFERGTTGKHGTGLGLAIARRAVEAQGGTIHAESPEETGCHFWVSLPKLPEGNGPGSGPR